MYSGQNDKIINVSQNKVWSKKIKSVKFHKIVDGDHLSFLCGKQMDYMDEIIDIIKKT